MHVSFATEVKCVCVPGFMHLTSVIYTEHATTLPNTCKLMCLGLYYFMVDTVCTHA